MAKTTTESLTECIKLPIENVNLLSDTIQKAKDFALMHGAGMRSKTDFSFDNLNFAPFILTPSPFPRSEFHKAVELQTILNELMHKVAYDEEFLRSTLKETIKVDEFTRNLFQIYEKVLKIGDVQDTVCLGLFRSDYLSQCFDDNAIKQVEFNTIASSFGGISTHMRMIQNYVLAELGEYDKLKDLPENNALSGLCNGMLKAWELFGNPNATILFVIENISYNICDQRFHEFEIRRLNPRVRVIRKTLTEIYENARLGTNKELIVEDDPVAVVYFRSAYEPSQYPTENEWAARLLIEQSSAIKCPTINFHLAGTKKVQQTLSMPGVLERFIKDPSKVLAVRNIFTGLYPLDYSKDGDKAFAMALKDPERFVLKPQREGGGNNVYGKDIPNALKSMSNDERSAWILMDRINPPITKGYMIRPGGKVPPPVSDLVSELGIFGVLIGTSNEITVNYVAGHMLRTKLATADEGGVAAGLGALDSPYLVD